MSRDELQELLDRADVSGAWLARKLEISRNVVSRWLRGKAPIPEARVEPIRQLLEPVPW